MTELIHRPLEEVLAGYYDFGNNYFICLDPQSNHKPYTAVHERTHINLGTSTNMGLFQQALKHFVDYQGYDKTPHFLIDIFNHTMNHVRDVHEAAATYAAFCTAVYHNYNGLSDMERTLPSDYKQWKRTFDDFFPNSIPVWARGQLAYHISRYAMNNTILIDYETLSYEKINNFSQYIAKAANSPNNRLNKIMSTIEMYGKDRFFADYLDCYDQNSTKLHNGYSDRTIENRKITFEIQAKLLRVMERSARLLAEVEPLFQKDTILAKNLVPAANKFSNSWSDFLRIEGYSQKISFRFIDTDDGAEVDLLDERQINISNKSQQSGMLPLEGNEKLLENQQYLARLWLWKDDEPCILSRNPLRLLHKNDLYLRLLPTKNLNYTYYSISENHSQIFRTLVNCARTVLVDGYDYSVLRDYFSALPNNHSLLVYWTNVNHFSTEVTLNGDIGVAYTHVPINDVYLVFVRDMNSTYHLFMAIDQTGLSLIHDRLTAEASCVNFTPDYSLLRPILNVLNAFFHQLL